jgi:TolB-like protein/Tfp pilus assembly protein PilF
VSIFSELKRRNVFRVAAAYAVVAWALIEVSDTVFPRLGLPDWTVTFVIVLLMLGFPLALFLSWAYELTPDGVRRTEDASPAESVAGRTGRRLDRLIVVGALGVVVLVGAERLWLAGRDAPRPAPAIATTAAPSIAVLPFVNMSDDAANVFFSDGVSEELLNLLAKIPELRVTSRSSSFSFRDQSLEIPEIAARLGVAHVLEGSVRKAGDRVRITVQLIDARTDAHLWSGTYDRALDDIFAIQDEIAAAVVAQMKVTLLGEAPTVAATDPEAYALYLEGRHLGLLGTAEGYEHSRALLERALAIDPEYAAAWVDLARNYFNEIALGLRARGEGAALALEATERALAIDPDLGPAHASLGWWAMRHGHDLAAAARHYERALALDPAHLPTIGNAAILVYALGRLETAIALMEYARARDPVGSVGHSNLGHTYLHAGRWDNAIASYLTALRLSPGRLNAHFFIGVALLFKGDPQAALEAIEQEPRAAARLRGLALAHHALGGRAASDAALDALIRSHGEEDPYAVATALAYRGEVDRAFQWLARSVEAEDGGRIGTHVDPLLANLHADPRWLPFLESIGQAPHQLDAIEFRVSLPG